MGTGGRTDSLVGYHFMVEVKGAFMGGFRECSGLGSEHEVIDDPRALEKGETVIQKIPGKLKWTNIVLKRGITDSMDLWNWRKKIEEGKVDENRHNGSIVLYSQSNEEVARWNFENGWPCKISGPALNAGGSEVAVEELEIAHEKLYRVK